MKNTETATNERIEGGDILKALLILLVIVGHIITVKLNASFLRSVIYYFHMPAFLALSGYFWKERESIGKVIEIAWKRYILAFFIATAAYYLFRIIVHNKKLPFTFEQSILEPYYHL